jgi:hypothetical protein
MTKKQKLRRNSFAADFNAGEDDFILADLDVMRNEEEPSPVPLNHFLDDEEIINRLLVNPGFSANDQQEEDDKVSDAMVVDYIDLNDELSGSDRFVIEPIERAKQNHPEVEEIPDSDIPLMADFDPIPDEEDAIDRLLVDAGFEAIDELEEADRKQVSQEINGIDRAKEFDVNIEEQNTMTTDTGAFDSEKNELELDKDATNVLKNPAIVKQEQTGVEAPAKHKPDLALNSLNEMGINELNSFATELENIRKLINDCENKVKKAVVMTYASLGFGCVALFFAVVMGVMVSRMETKISKLSDLVSILEEDMGSIAGKNPDLEISNSASSIEQLNKKLNGLPEVLEEQIRSSSEISENEMTADLTKQAAVNKSNDKQQTKTSVAENKKPSEATTKKISAEKKSTRAQTAPSWSVNLTAFEDQSYAKGKAAKFIQKGIPVKVIAVDMNNKTWYRLKVGGFKNKEEATSYAAKIKKSLNLNSVSVANN